MNIAVLSGKGGTGKTTVSCSLASSLENAQYIDCDVEEPNGSIFLKPVLSVTNDVMVDVPLINKEKCTGCKKCFEACQFNAIAVIKEKAIVFNELCHHCGACSLACEYGAITQVPRKVGVVERNEDSSFIHGKLNIGEPVSVTVIAALKKNIDNDRVTIIDCPPGSSCSVVEAVEDTDFCILVTEPTPFGLHDLDIAVKLIKKIGIPFGVVVNKAQEGINIIRDYCLSNNIDILLEIPFSRNIASDYSKGILPIDTLDNLKEDFKALFAKIEGSVEI